MNKEKELKKKQELSLANLQNKTKEIISNLTYDQQLYLLTKKWISPIITGIETLPDLVISTLTNKVNFLEKKYEETMGDISEKIEETEKHLDLMLDDLVGDKYDAEGIKEFQKLLRGNKNE